LRASRHHGHRDPRIDHPDLPEEQAYLDRAYECLEDMRQQAARGARIVAGDPYAEEAISQMFLSRLADVSEETALCFGRIDRVDGDLFYIGRRHVHDENLDPVVIDWRHPGGAGRRISHPGGRSGAEIA